MKYLCKIFLLGVEPARERGKGGGGTCLKEQLLLSVAARERGKGGTCLKELVSRNKCRTSERKR